MGKPVFQYDLEGNLLNRFNSQQEAADSIGVSEFAIRAWIKGIRRHEKYKWTNEPLSLIEAKDSFQKELDRVTPVAIKNEPKILLIDLETMPLQAFVFRVWKENISQDQIISDWFCAVWAAKWLDSDEVISDAITSEEIKKQDDKRIITSLHKLIDEADVIIAHNLKKFDQPRMLTRFLYHNLPPVSPYREIDTLEVAKKQFGFTSNKLDAINKFLGLQRKIDADFTLWTDCMSGKKEALLQMEVYCIQDIKCLEGAYLKLRPFMRNHPNLDMYFDDGVMHCPHCTSINVVPEISKYAYTQAVEYQVFRCLDCGAVMRAKKGNKFIHKKSISPIPR